MLPYRAHTKHSKAAAPSLQSIDFVSIAVNSVGGGGVPRPYGQFTAARAGDGNATWQRLPPQAGTWQAKALPIAVTLLSDEQLTAAEGGDPSPRSGGSMPVPGGPETEAASHPSFSPRRSLTHPHRRGHGLSTYPGPGRGRGQQHRSHLVSLPSKGGVGLGAGALGAGGAGPLSRSQQEQLQYRRPGSSVHRSLVPLPPPEPHNTGAWFPLPSATFLAEVPTIPPSLRMDNGFSVSREFLMSGLHTKPQRQRHTAPSQYGDGGAAWDSGADPRFAGQGGLVEALDQGGHSSLPFGAVGPKGLRGVYVPIDNRAHLQQLQQHRSPTQPPLHYQHELQQQPSPSANHPPSPPQQLPQQQQELASQTSMQASSLAVENSHSLLAGPLVTRGALELPPEQTLPRRNVPTGW
ncbi:hypothetical protein GPECTOR_1g278 [Gonium pectorale]|uniref:Uncharacterized protein n=1 Tax=Gonium pectorale TaxID=33097 RepID=A0A150H2Q4_GONPE|nr:hypothetical protein GPECTOR_1g278 [Gonium pectorale]|eukprot:KXZ56315.1 hypothetical protein GPECTOR_1g278 [Gonium pectorale]